VNRSGLRVAAFFVGAAIIVSSPTSSKAAETTIAGFVTHVRDGDTLEVGRTVVRLQGVAAPERGEPLAAEATRALRSLVTAREVRCVPDGTRSRGRVVAVCRVAGLDVGAVLVRRGLARDCVRYSRGRYAADEEAAADAGAGIRGTYALPSYCRERMRRRG
jgi:endonuclease YncB( thermonuclease family)